ncbi:Bro-N domain-containing protein [Acinetobacter bereziniae]|uniref:BRO-N domain-containing protein n=1 Tax=Acinetobacter bereziniae TaxID=106648 RepID=UPI003AF6DF93
MTSLSLSFNEVKFNPVQHEQQIWLTASELSKALGYKQTDAVSKVYNRNSDEFTANMTQVIDNPHTPNLGVRIFSLRGCHLVAMFARTSIAKSFRKWVLDILDKEVGQPIAKTHKSEREPLTNAVNLLVAKTKHLNYSDAYKLVHQRFNVKHIDEIPYDAIPVAVEYVHHLIVLFSNQTNQQESLKPWQDQNVQFLMWYVPKLAKIIKNDIYPALTLLRSELSGQVIAITHEALCHANLLNRIALKNGMTHYTKLGGQPLHTFNGF